MAYSINFFSSFYDHFHLHSIRLATGDNQLSGLLLAFIRYSGKCGRFKPPLFQLVQSILYMTLLIAIQVLRLTCNKAALGWAS